jgi:Flp pilus assembly protein TadG
VRTKTRDDQGATLPLIALSLVLLMGMAAIVVDIGNGRQIRRQAQSAVDAAALAAVVDYNGNAGTQAASTARAIEYVEDNGFSDASTDIQVSFSTNAAGEPCVLVRINNYPVATFFGRALGATTLPVTAESIGCQTPNTVTLPGLMAGGTCSGSGKAFVISGNDNRMIGSIHSNYDVLESGNNNVLTGGTATFSSNPRVVSGTAPHWWDPASGPVAQMTWPPISFNITDYQPGGSHAFAGNYFSFTGDRSLSGTINSGVYYTTGKWELTNIAVNAFNGHTGATFVTNGGVIELKGNSVIRPFDLEMQKLTFFAGWAEPGKQSPTTNRCDSETMKVSGNCNRFDGVAYVPFGKYTASGEGNGHDYNTGSGQCGSQAANPSHAGGVLAWAINVNGNYNLYRGGNVPDGTGTPYLSS